MVDLDLQDSIECFHFILPERKPEEKLLTTAYGIDH